MLSVQAPVCHGACEARGLDPEQNLLKIHLKLAAILARVAKACDGFMRRTLYRLPERFAALQGWCEEECATNLEEILQCLDQLIAALALKPLEGKRLQRALLNA
eukprot:4449117-Amphidinium_carterae.1